MDYANNEKENIPPAYIRKLEKRVVGDPYFNAESASKASVAILSLFFWVRALYDFDKIFKNTEPLRIKLAEATAIVNDKTATLKEK
jgi:dynein heavy chain